MATSLKLTGVIPPLITPLTSDRQLDTDAVYRLVKYLVENGVSGLFILGTSGEGPWLTTKDRRLLAQTTVAAAAGRVPVLAGVLEPSTERTLEAIDQLADTGITAVVTTTPYYFNAEAAVQSRHIATVAAHSSLPIVLYNIPNMTHNPLAVSTVAEALKFDNVIGVKDSAGNWDDFEALLALRVQRPDFNVFQGAEKLASKSMLAGADGLVPGLGNLVPHLFVQLNAADDTVAKAVQAEIDALWTLQTYGYWLPCLKYAAALLGFGSGHCCSRPVSLPSAAQDAIQKLVNAAPINP